MFVRANEFRGQYDNTTDGESTDDDDDDGDDSLSMVTPSIIQKTLSTFKCLALKRKR
jgi:hypothetical protein